MSINTRDLSAFDSRQIRQLLDAFGSGGKKDSEIETLSNKILTAPAINAGTGSLTATLLSSLLKLTGTTFIADGVIPATVSWAKLDASAATCDMSIAAPTAGLLMVISAVNVDNSVTVTMTAGDFDGAGAGGDVATFNAVEDTLVLFGINATRWIIVANESVTLG